MYVHYNNIYILYSLNWFSTQSSRSLKHSDNDSPLTNCRVNWCGKNVYIHIYIINNTRNTIYYTQVKIYSFFYT